MIPRFSTDDRACPLCGSFHNDLLLDRRAVPVLLNHLAETADEAARAPVGYLRIVSCAECGFTFNSRFDPNLIVYEETYENDQSFSPHFADHIAGRVQAILRTMLATNASHVLEIGCGQGSFLEKLLRMAPEARAVGYDAAWRTRQLPPRLRIERTYFDAEAISVQAEVFDVCIARHVIEHVADPVGFLLNSYLALKDGGRLFVETPDLEWIIANGQMHDFFYEHCNYFTETTLADAFSRAGFSVLRIERTFGDQYLWAEAIRARQKTARGRNLAAGLMPDRARMKSFFAEWRCRVSGERRHVGTIVVWGAGAKGVTFVNEVDPKRQLIDYLIDVNPNKASKFVPVSCHPVLSPDQSLVRRPPQLVLVMNPLYMNEIQAVLHKRGLTPLLLAA